MNASRLAFFLSAMAIVCALRAQDDDQQQQKPPTEIPDFSNLDEYIYVPKSTAKFGYRYISGAKTHFSGSGIIAAPEDLPDESAPNIARSYHDGSVGPDTRTVSVDVGNGNTALVSTPSDGKTNNWSYTDPGQLTSDGYMQFHLYSAATQAENFGMTGKGNVGMELTVAHDMQRFNRHLQWRLFGGMSVNDLQAATFDNVNGTLTTVTDTYDLFGQTPPAPGAGSQTATPTITNPNGSALTDSSGNTLTSTVSNNVLLGDAPLARSSTPSAVAAASGEIVNHYKLHGAYATFRGGPQLVYDFNDHLHLTVSVGPALIMAGSNFTVTEALTPPTGTQIIDTVTNTTNRLLLGYYVDAQLQYDLSDRTGFYVGAFGQSANNYHETASASSTTISANGASYSATSGNASYTTDVDFTNQQGFEAGLSYKF
jgi:hypothetical protein